MIDLAPELLEKPDFHDQIKNIIKNGDPSSLTAGQIRNELETHFGLEKDALRQKPYKKIMNEIIDKTYTELQKEQEPQEHTPTETDSSREVSPIKPSPKKRKAAPLETEERPLFTKKTKVESDDGTEDVKPKKTKRKKKQSKKVISDSEDEKMEDASDEDDKEEEEANENDDEEEADETDFSTTPPTTKKTRKTRKKTAKSSAATTKDEETVKRLKQFINKCGVRKVWAKELNDCKDTTAEISKLKAMLEELGVHGRPTLEKCEAVKKERELKAELDSLDTTLIINEASRRTRTRNSSQNRPSYAVDASSSDEEDTEEQAGQHEASADTVNESGNESDAKTDDTKEESEDEESPSDDEFQGDESEEDA
ncbi:transcriptional regulator [Mucor ambiguus]|uniref:Transcriptional regulator n=1 Tax=Mucor ambiguus TaxID=91626 RepID=A0A0C9M462_9FUNG|nr:transcriptional regulator [Mucor ambiguus]